MAVQIQLRRGLAADWTSANPILGEGEMGVEIDTLQMKLGDGITAWADLPYGGIQGPAGDPGPPGADGSGGGVMFGSFAPGGTPGDDVAGWLWPGGVYVGANPSFTMGTLMRLCPFTLDADMILKGARTAVSGAIAGKLLRLGIYAADANFNPGAVAADLGTVSAASNGIKTITGRSDLLTAGHYFAAIVGDAAFTVDCYRAIAHSSVDYSGYGWFLTSSVATADPLVASPTVSPSGSGSGAIAPFVMQLVGA